MFLLRERFSIFCSTVFVSVIEAGSYRYPLALEYEIRPISHILLSAFLIAAAHAAVTGIQLGFQQQQVVVDLVRTQLGHPFGGLPVLHTAVVVAGSYQHRWVGLGADILVGRVALDAGKYGAGIMRVAPFVVFGDGQRQIGVLHGVEHIDKRHLGGNSAARRTAQDAG